MHSYLEQVVERRCAASQLDSQLYATEWLTDMGYMPDLVATRVCSCATVTTYLYEPYSQTRDNIVVFILIRNREFALNLHGRVFKYWLFRMEMCRSLSQVIKCIVKGKEMQLQPSVEVELSIECVQTRRQLTSVYEMNDVETGIKSLVNCGVMKVN